MMNNRKGVSLITVLMFMLVATIAATATFKWLSSEGASSTDRLLVNEARASAVAGVEAARAWMTFHGNETGAVLKQFNDANRGISKNKIPLRLDDVLAPMAKDDQSFKVSIVDVQASGAMATYEVKIISKGKARNGQAEYTEAAVFAVSGLYQVPIPKPEPPAPYHYAYFGGSTSFSGEHKVTSMIINGDWGLGEYQYGSNPGHIDHDFIVTGRTVLSGNNIYVGGTGCFGGNLEVDNGLTGKDIYVAGNATKNKYGQAFVTQLSGDAYFNGNVEIGNQAIPGFHIGGSMTLNGNLITHLDKFDHSIDGDLCLSDSATIEFSGSSDKNLWTVGGNVHIPKSFLSKDRGLKNAQENERYVNRIFGNKKSSRVYIRDAFKCDGHYCNKNGIPSSDVGSCNNSDLNECKAGISYQIHKDNGNPKSYSSFTTKGIVVGTEYSNPPFECSKHVKSYCDSIWHPVAKGEKKCDDANYKVNDLLVTSYDKFVSFALNGKSTGVSECSGVDYLSKDNTNNMNKCYASLSSNKEKAKKYLYNGYAVFKLTPDENKSSEADNNGAPKLNGKFIFIYESQLNGSNPHFVQTTADSRVFVYLKKGSAKNSKINCQAEGKYNYFVYTEADIYGLLGSCTWNGSFYARAENCAKIPEINGNSTLQYGPEVINDMYEAKIICANDGSPCGGAPSSSASGPSSSASGEVEDEYDSIYVSTGDHLIVTVESEYKSKEKVVNDTMRVQPSMMIFPRVVYLNQDAVGKLSDYYSVIPLNGLKMTGTGTMASSSTLAPPATGKLITKKGENLTKGIYSYTYTYAEAGRQYKSDFYVVVAGKSSETPLVHFTGGAFNAFIQGASNSADVGLSVAGSSGTGQFAVKISISDKLTGWNITNHDGSAVQWQNAADGTRYVVITKNMSENDTEYKLFKISTNSDAASGTIRFTLQAPESCILGGGPIVQSFNIKGTATIHRASLAEYCSKYPDICAADNDSLKKVLDYEECPSVTDEWVKINCIGASTVTKNNEWTCDAGVGSANVVKLYKGRYETSKCILYIPEDNNFIDNPKDDRSNTGGYFLYASLKRKAYRLKIDKQGVHGGSRINVSVSESENGSYTTISPESCSDGLCTYVVYANQYFKATVQSDGDRFSKWICHTCTDRSTKIRNDHTLKHVMGHDFYITAVFNEKDDHCFYSEFENTDIWCNSDIIECINNCGATKKKCSVTDGYNGYKNPSWVVVNSKGGDDKKPVKTGAGALYYVPTVTGLIKKDYGDPAILLNSVNGGSEGSFDVRVQTDVVSTAKKESSLLNSGLIVRSNDDASEYILVTFFGVNLTGANIAAVDAYARACYIKDFVRFNKEDDNCERVMLKSKNTSITSLAFLYSTQLNMTINLNGDSLILSGTYSASAQLYEVVAKFDLKNVVKQGSYTLNDDTHNRVGLKLSDAEFKVYDATWNSKKYSDECFANPRVFCSFTAKYMDGEIPLNENVTPSLGYSSWFVNEGKECMNNTKFYYNGCDLPISTLGSFFNNGAYCADGVCSDGHVENYIGNNGFNVPDGYLFRCDGPHGFPHATRNGFVRNASVEVNCNKVNGKKYEADCGQFYVGKINNCQQDETILNFPLVSDIRSKLTVPELPITIYNLRDADLVFDMTIEAGKSVSVQLEDENKKKSDAFILSQTGENRVPYSKFSNQSSGFNPEKVKKVHLQGTASFAVKSIKSRCANSLKVYCGMNDAQFDGGYWKIKANIQPFDAAKKCYVKAINGGVSGEWFGSCNEMGEFFIEDPSFLERVNESKNDIQVDFNVSVYDDDNATETSVATHSCVASSQTYKQVQLTCELIGDKRDFVQGTGVAGLKFNAENCPSNGCDFEATLSDVSRYSDSEEKAKGITTWTPNVNVTSQLAPGNYSYQVKLFSDEKKARVLGTCVTPSFKVIEAKPARATSCSVMDGKTFTAFVEGSNYENVTAALVYTDKLGNLITSEKTVMVSANDILKFPISITEDGDYILTLKLNGLDACSQSYHHGSGVSAIHLTCPADISNQDASSAITVNPTVSGCEKSDCKAEIDKASSGSPQSNWNGSGFSFYHVGGTGTQEYTLKVSKSGTTDKSCKFKVSFASSGSGGASATCTLDNTEAYVGDKVALRLSNMRPNKFRLEILVDGEYLIDPIDDYYYGVSFPRDGRDYVQLKKEGTTTIVVKFDGQTVCTKTITVKKGKPSGGTIVLNPTSKYTAGTYNLTSCNGKTGTNDIQVSEANMTNCLSVFSNASSPNYWNNNSSQCNGQVKVTFPATMTIPEGKYVEFQGGCW